MYIYIIVQTFLEGCRHTLYDGINGAYTSKKIALQKLKKLKIDKKCCCDFQIVKVAIDQDCSVIAPQ